MFYFIHVEKAKGNRNDPLVHLDYTFHRAFKAV